MTDPVSIEILAERQRVAHEQLEHVVATLDRLEREEKSRLRAGISGLGAILIALGTLIWTYRQVIVGGGGQ